MIFLCSSLIFSQGKLPPQPAVKPRQPPVTSDEWERLRDDLGRLTPDKEQFFRARVFAGVMSMISLDLKIFISGGGN